MKITFIFKRWLSIKLEMMGSTLLLFACVFAILARKTLSPGLAGLSITNSLNIATLMSWIVFNTSQLESNLTSYERVKEYCHTPNEVNNYDAINLVFKKIFLENFHFNFRLNGEIKQIHLLKIGQFKGK